ncbi:MAG: hypothetical protein J6T06_00350, partial [Victivallales bacterium]|nr:hypothetical protein [Victivallales bacterium]
MTTVFVTAILVIILNFSMLWQATMIPDGDDVLLRQITCGHDTFYCETFIEHPCHDRYHFSFLSGLESAFLSGLESAFLSGLESAFLSGLESA